MADTKSRTRPAPNALSGEWHNQHGSQLVLRADGEGGLRGEYRSGTGSVAGTSYPLVGRYDPMHWGPAMVLGFVVDWTEVHCVTVWSGDYFPADGIIRATWLMTSETDPGDEWKSTVIGHDVFRREPS